MITPKGQGDDALIGNLRERWPSFQPMPPSPRTVKQFWFRQQLRLLEFNLVKP
ncbi:MAG: hypothetical protein LBT86_00800 [Deltaproteobacteria bacterium]|nr:hypothetical protein [Deltaproteobacteria bacterium]